MTTVLVWIIFIVVMGVVVANLLLKGQQRAHGMGRCRFCGARMKFTGFNAATKHRTTAGFASVCRKCGRAQV
jgi:hypothetical protein